MSLFLQCKQTIKFLFIVLPFAVVAEENNGSIVFPNQVVDTKLADTPFITPAVSVTPAITPAATSEGDIAPTVTPAATLEEDITPTVTPAVAVDISPNVTTVIPEKDLKPLLFPSPIFDISKLVYEPNNSFDDAKPIFVDYDGQAHKFDYAEDEDWLKFYAEKNKTYFINLNLDSAVKGVNPAIELYNADNEIEAQLVDFNGAGKGEILSWEATIEGYYYIRVINKDIKFTKKSHYKISVFNQAILAASPAARLSSVSVSGKVVNQCTKEGILAAIGVHGDQKITVDTGEFGLSFSPGTYTLTASATNLQEKSKTITVEGDGELIKVNFELSPEAGCSANVDPKKTPFGELHTMDEVERLKHQAVASYDPSTGILKVKDVRVGDDILKVTLKGNPESNFLLTKVDHLAKGVSERPAFYNNDSSLADIPDLFVIDRLYKVKLRRLSNQWRFVVDQQDQKALN